MLWWLALACGGGAIVLPSTESEESESQLESESEAVSDTETEQPEALTLEEHEDVATVLLATFTLEEDVDDSWLLYETDDSSFTTPPTTRSAGEYTVPLLGLPSETAVTVALVTVVDGKETTSPRVAGSTGRLPSRLFEPDLVSWDEDATDPEPWVLTSVDVGSYNFGGPCFAVILDRQGRIVWYHETSESRLTMFPHVALDGTHLIIEGTTYYTYGSEVPSLMRLTLDLERYEEEEFPNMGLAWSEAPDGTIFYDRYESAYDYSLYARGPDGVDREVWSCTDWMEQFQSVGYWDCAANTALYHAATDTVLYSMFETSTVVEIDANSGEVVRYFGDIEGGWTFEPRSAAIELQHWPNYTPDGNIILSTHTSSYGEQRIREFSLDEDREQLVLEWSWGEDSPYYADYAGEATRRTTGHTLHGLGTDGVLLELDGDDIVWAVEWENHLIGHATLIDDLYDLVE